MGDASSSYFRDKDASVLPADDGDAQRLCAFLHHDIAGFFQVWPGGKEVNILINISQEKQLQGDPKEHMDRVRGRHS